MGPTQTDPLFRMGYIDFGSSFIFPIGASDHTVRYDQAQTTPPSGIKAPEQSLESGSWDAYAADVYNLGTILRDEVAGKACTFRSSDISFGLSNCYIELHCD